jgi:hypothetical protein
MTGPGTNEDTDSEFNRFRRVGGCLLFAEGEAGTFATTLMHRCPDVAAAQLELEMALRMRAGAPIVIQSSLKSDLGSGEEVRRGRARVKGLGGFSFGRDVLLKWGYVTPAH